jgi:hypothetical protein
MLHGVKAGALSEHPPGKDTLDLAVQLDLVHLHERSGVWRLHGRTRIADPRRHFQRAELHRLIDRYFKMRDAPCHLVEGGEYGDRILDLVCARIRSAEHRNGGEETEQKSEANAAQSRFRLLHYASHFLNRHHAYRPGAPLASKGLDHESGMGVARNIVARPASPDPLGGKAEPDVICGPGSIHVAERGTQQLDDL